MEKGDCILSSMPGEKAQSGNGKFPDRHVCKFMSIPSNYAAPIIYVSSPAKQAGRVQQLCAMIMRPHDLQVLSTVTCTILALTTCEAW